MNRSESEVDWPPLEPLPAIILSGGRSRRMGTDKTRLPWRAGGTVYSQVEDIFAALASHLVVVIGHDGIPPDSGRNPVVVHDEFADLGPLEGLRVGLKKCDQLGASLAMVTTSDAPLVVPELYRFMVKTLLDAPEVQAVAPFVDNTWHPLTAVWRTTILDEIEDRVRSRRLRVKDLLDALTVGKLTRDVLEQYDPGLQSIQNLNTREQYLRLRSQLDSPDEPDLA